MAHGPVVKALSSAQQRYGAMAAEMRSLLPSPVFQHTATPSHTPIPVPPVRSSWGCRSCLARPAQHEQLEAAGAAGEGCCCGHTDSNTGWVTDLFCTTQCTVLL